MDETRADILWLREQWNPVTCEPELVEKYGNSRGVPRTRFDTDESYRNRVINAYSWHKLAGKVRGLERIFRENGFEAWISNLDNPDYWAHFRLDIDVNNRVIDSNAMQLALYLANEYKPARSIMEVLATNAQIVLTIWRAPGTIRQKTHSFQTLYFDPPKSPTLFHRPQPAVLSATSTRQQIRFFGVKPEFSKKIGIGQQEFTCSRVRLSN